MSTRSISWGKGGRCLRLTTLPPSCAVVMTSGNLNFLEPSGPLQACNGTDLTLPFIRTNYYVQISLKYVCLYNVNVVCFLLGRKLIFKPLTPNVDYSGRTAPLTSKCCILYIYSKNIGTENFKHGIYSLFFPLQNAVCLINLTYLVPVLFTFFIQGVLKLKK